jgi:hypothetical protein
MGYSARVLADSISEVGGIRLTTLEATFPRPYLAEFNTHRMFSRNSASSRAIPPEKNIERVINDPYIPETFGARVKGMGYGIDLDPENAEKANRVWRAAAQSAVRHAHALNEANIDKSRVNRLLEPFMWHTVIVTATDWDNFWYLRQPMNGPVPNAEHGAQPEMQIIARMMREAYMESEPKLLLQDEWHLPLVDPNEWGFAVNNEDERKAMVPQVKRVSTRRVARVSFDKHTDTEPWSSSVIKAGDLLTNFHLSPTEHVARQFSRDEWHAIREGQQMVAKHRQLGNVMIDHICREMEYIGNFHGYVQFRKEIPDEHNALLATQNRST